MAGDIKDAGALAGVGRYGVPWHGRIEAGTLYTGKGAPEITRPWAQPASSDCWLVQRPGLPDPYLDDAEAKTADALEGKELTNWALVSGAGDIHGKAFTRTNDDKHRWIWIDANGDAFAVVFGLVDGVAETSSTNDYDGFPARDFSFAAAVTARFKFTRFGKLVQGGIPAADTVVVDHVLPAGALGQAEPEIIGRSAGNVILRDITPTGARALFEVHSLTQDTPRNIGIFEDSSGGVAPTRKVSHREFSNSLGWVEFTLSGTGAAPVVEFALLANRVQTLGTWSLSVPIYEVDKVVDVYENVDIHSIYQSTGRIIGYQYDAAGVAQPHHMDYRHEYRYSYAMTYATYDGLVSKNLTRSTAHTMQVKVFAGLNSVTVNRAASVSDVIIEYDESGPLAHAIYERNYTVTGDSGAPDENFSIDTTEGDISYSAPSYGYPFETASQKDSLLFPTAGQDRHMRLGVFRLGQNTYALFYGAIDETYTIWLDTDMTRSLAVLSRDTLQHTYNAWPSWRTSARRYGARNPITQELFFPRWVPVNFT